MKKKNRSTKFKGKCLSVKIKKSDEIFDLYDPYFEKREGRLFIIGSIPVNASESNWAAGAKQAIAWKSITSYIIFDDLASYSEAVETALQYQKKQLN